MPIDICGCRAADGGKKTGTDEYAFTSPTRGGIPEILDDGSGAS